MTIAKRTIAQAEFFLGQAEQVAASDRVAFVNYIEAAIVFARSVTFHLQKEFSDRRGFDEWYALKQEELRGDALARFLLDKRNYVLKEGGIGMRGHMQIKIQATVEAHVSLDIKIKRAAPWYRRSLRILIDDATWPLRNWFHQRQQRGRRAIVRTRATTSTATVSLFFIDEDWNKEPAMDLIRRHLGRLSRMVAEAEATFSPATQGST